MKAQEVREWLECEATQDDVAKVFASAMYRIQEEGRNFAEAAEAELKTFSPTEYEETVGWFAEWNVNFEKEST